MLGYVQEAKAENAVAALARMTAVTSAVVRDGQVQRVPSAELVRGDLLVLGEGDAVGADARLVQAASLRVQEASLTGESEAVLKDAATLPGPAALGDRLDMVFKGTAVAQGTGRAVVTATGMDTEMGAIAEMLEATEEEPTPLQKEVARIGRMLGIAVVVIAVVVVATILLISDIRSAADVITVLLLGVSLAVAAVPEGLPAILSVVLAHGRAADGEAQRHREEAVVGGDAGLGLGHLLGQDRHADPLGDDDRAGDDRLGRHPRHRGRLRARRAGSSTRAASSTPGRCTPSTSWCSAAAAWPATPTCARRADGEWEIQGDPTEAAFLVAERKLGVAERRERRFERIARDPVHLRAQDDVDDRGRPRARRRARGDHQGRAGRAARALHPRARGHGRGRAR